MTKCPHMSTGECDICARLRASQQMLHNVERWLEECKQERNAVLQTLKRLRQERDDLMELINKLSNRDQT